MYRLLLGELSLNILFALSPSLSLFRCSTSLTHWNFFTVRNRSNLSSAKNNEVSNLVTSFFINSFYCLNFYPTFPSLILESETGGWRASFGSFGNFNYIFFSTLNDQSSSFCSKLFKQSGNRLFSADLPLFLLPHLPLLSIDSLSLFNPHDVSNNPLAVWSCSIYCYSRLHHPPSSLLFVWTIKRHSKNSEREREGEWGREIEFSRVRKADPRDCQISHASLVTFSWMTTSASSWKRHYFMALFKPFLGGNIRRKLIVSMMWVKSDKIR